MSETTVNTNVSGGRKTVIVKLNDEREIIAYIKAVASPDTGAALQCSARVILKRYFHVSSVQDRNEILVALAKGDMPADVSAKEAFLLRAQKHHD